jgi:predicted O-methyltransferase YrrM
MTPTYDPSLFTSLPPAIGDFVRTRFFNHEGRPPMHGWCSQAKAAKLARTTIDLQPALAVEIGVFAGRSMFIIALALQAIGRGIVLGIDPFDKQSSMEGYDGENRSWWGRLDHNEIYTQFKEVRTSLSVEPHTALFVGRSDQAMPILRACNARVDLLHIDGNHGAAASHYDATHYVPLVPPGGIIYFDDLGWDTTSEAVAHIKTQTKTLGEVDGCGVFQKLLPAG